MRNSEVFFVLRVAIVTSWMLLVRAKLYDRAKCT